MWERIGRRGWAVIGGLAVVVALASSLLGLRNQLFGSESSGPGEFSGSIADAEGARDFVDFLKENDGKRVTLDVRCVQDGMTWCLGADMRVPTGYDLEVFVGSSPCFGFEGCPGAYWIEIEPTGDVQVDNGSFGAGNLVVKGPFSVLVEGMKGSAPPDVNVVSLRGLQAE